MNTSKKLGLGPIRPVLSITIASLLAATAVAAPKVILISLDGATPRLVNQYTTSGALAPGVGLRLLEEKGVKANQNLTINPSLTAAAHIAIATGSDAASNDVPGNSYRLLATPMTAGNTTSGFGGPIGGYQLNPVAMSPSVTALPIWASLRAAPYNKTVVTATWPGGDGVNVTVPGLAGSPIIQPASERTVDYTVPFGAFSSMGGVPGVPSGGAHGYSLTAASFSPAPVATVNQLTAAGVTFIATTPVLQKTTPLMSFTPTASPAYNIHLVAYDTTNDATVNYDSLVFFNDAQGIQPGPFSLPSTGPAYVQAPAPGTADSALFYLEGHAVKAGLRFFCTQFAPDLSTLRVAHTSSNFIPRNAPVLGNVDDINNNVGFWQPQPDFRIVERISPGFAPFPDLEVEAMYDVLVSEFTTYQKNIVLRALNQFPNADLAMFYFEQPDGSGHQYFLTDPRQPTDFTNPNSIYGGQDLVKKARYAQHLQNAYVDANNAVQAVINAVGVDGNGVPNSNVIVTSDHGFETFHTAVQMTNLLTTSGIDINKIRVVTTGPAVNVYIRLAGRGTGGTITKTEYLTLQAQITNILRNYKDTNATYNTTGPVNIFDQVIARPLPADINDVTFGLRTSEFIGQDSGDVFATLVPGYNFDGLQTPPVNRLGDGAGNIFTVPNFYGAHGYDPMLPNMSAIFYAAGPNVTYSAAPIPIMANMDIAPTIARILGVPPAATVQGRALNLGPVTNYLMKATSRKTHGASGNFDLPLPLTAAPSAATVDGRRPGAGNTHQIVFFFANPVTTGTASVTAGIGSVGTTTFFANEMRVELTGVNDIQNVTVSFLNVNDGSTLVSGSVNVSFLQGDVNGDRTVNVTDQNETKSLGFATPTVTKTNYRADAVVNGTVNTADVAFVKSKNGNVIP